MSLFRKFQCNVLKLFNNKVFNDSRILCYLFVFTNRSLQMLEFIWTNMVFWLVISVPTWGSKRFVVLTWQKRPFLPSSRPKYVQCGDHPQTHTPISCPRPGWRSPEYIPLATSVLLKETNTSSSHSPTRALRPLFPPKDHLTLVRSMNCGSNVNA